MAQARLFFFRAGGLGSFRNLCFRGNFILVLPLSHISLNNCDLDDGSLLTWLGWFGQDTWLRFWGVFGRAWSSGQGRQSGSSGTQVDLVSCARQVSTLIDYCFLSHRRTWSFMCCRHTICISKHVQADAGGRIPGQLI